VPEGLLLVVWSSIGLCVGLVRVSKVFTLRRVGLGWVSRLVGCVWLKKLDPPQTALIHSKRTETRDDMYSRFHMPVRLYVCPPAYLNSFLSVLSVVVARSSPAGVLSYLSI